MATLVCILQAIAIAGESYQCSLPDPDAPETRARSTWGADEANFKIENMTAWMQVIIDRYGPGGVKIVEVTDLVVAPYPSSPRSKSPCDTVTFHVKWLDGEASRETNYFCAVESGTPKTRAAYWALHYAQRDVDWCE